MFPRIIRLVSSISRNRADARARTLPPSPVPLYKGKNVPANWSFAIKCHSIHGRIETAAIRGNRLLCRTASRANASTGDVHVLAVGRDKSHPFPNQIGGQVRVGRRAGELPYHDVVANGERLSHQKCNDTVPNANDRRQPKKLPDVPLFPCAPPEVPRSAE